MKVIICTESLINDSNCTTLSPTLLVACGKLANQNRTKTKQRSGNLSTFQAVNFISGSLTLFARERLVCEVVFAKGKVEMQIWTGIMTAPLIRRGDRDDRWVCGVQHPVRDRDVRALLQDGAPPHVVAPLPRLHLLLHLTPHAHRLLPRRGKCNLSMDLIQIGVQDLPLRFPTISVIRFRPYLISVTALL